MLNECSFIPPFLFSTFPNLTLSWLLSLTPQRLVSLLWKLWSSHQSRSFQFFNTNIYLILLKFAKFFCLFIFLCLLEIRFLDRRSTTVLQYAETLHPPPCCASTHKECGFSSGTSQAVGALGTIAKDHRFTKVGKTTKIIYCTHQPLKAICLSTLAVIHCDAVRMKISYNFFVSGKIHFILNSAVATIGGLQGIKCRHIRSKFLHLNLYSQKREVRTSRDKLIWNRVDKSCLENAPCSLQAKMKSSAVVFRNWDSWIFSPMINHHKQHFKPL